MKRTTTGLLTAILLIVSIGCVNSRQVDPKTMGGHCLLISGRAGAQCKDRPGDLVLIEVPKQRLNSKTSFQIEEVISKSVNKSRISIEKEKLGAFATSAFFRLFETNGQEYCFVMSSEFFLLKEDRWIKGNTPELWDLIIESIENGSIRCKRQKVTAIDVLPDLSHDR